jgi:hypothetical protein
LTLARLRYGPAMPADYRPSLVRSFERHLRAENRSEHTIASVEIPDGSSVEAPAPST